MTDDKSRGSGSQDRPRRRAARIEPVGGQLSLPLWEPGETGYQGARVLSWRPAEPKEDELPVVSEASLKGYDDREAAAGSVDEEDSGEPEALEQEAFEGAAAAYEAGDLALAIRLYRLVVRSTPGDATAWFNLGVALEEQGSDEHAQAAYAKVTEVDPEFADAWWNAARLHEKHGRKSLAIQCFKEYKACGSTLSEHPEDPETAT